MKLYQPSNKVPSAGFMWLILSSVLGGLALGGLAFVVSRIIYVIIAFPIVIGLLGGVAIEKGIQRGKVRNPLIASLFAAFTGIVIYSTLHAGEYLTFRQAASQYITKQLGQSNDSEIEAIVDAYLQEKTGSTGFWGFLKYQAKEGTIISEIGHNDEPIPLNKTFTLLYWLIELAVIDGIIIIITYWAAKQPFCESCDRWYDEPKRIGNVSDRSSESFLNFLDNDNYIESGKLIEPLVIKSNSSLEIHFQNCPCCQTGDRVITVSQVFVKSKLYSKKRLKLKQILQSSLFFSQYALLDKAIEKNFGQKSDSHS